MSSENTDQPAAGVTGAANSAPASSSGTSSTRLIVLLLVFGVALAGLLYDYCIARPAQKTAYEDIQGLLEGTTPDPNNDGTVTDDEVASVLGRKPSQTEHLDNGKIEIYTWRSGLPLKTHKLWVVFSGKKYPLLHYASTTRPNPTELPARSEYREPTKEELENFVPPPTPSGVGAGSSGGGGRGKGRPSSGDEGTDAATEKGDAEPSESEQEGAADATIEESGDSEKESDES